MGPSSLSSRSAGPPGLGDLFAGGVPRLKHAGGGSGIYKIKTEIGSL